VFGDVVATFGYLYPFGLLCWASAAALRRRRKTHQHSRCRLEYAVETAKRVWRQFDGRKETLHGWYAEAAATETDLLSLVGRARELRERQRQKSKRTSSRGPRSTCDRGERCSAVSHRWRTNVPMGLNARQRHVTRRRGRHPRPQRRGRLSHWRRLRAHFTEGSNLLISRNRRTDTWTASDRRVVFPIGS
jgi:hypothetical protein